MKAFNYTSNNGINRTLTDCDISEDTKGVKHVYDNARQKLLRVVGNTVSEFVLSENESVDIGTVK